MDIEKLTKSQIVLLTLLVSFVTSIATGIVTVSLMDQTPPAIAQTVNRVVERTVERIVPTETQAAASVVTRERTVVVQESERIASAVETARPSIVRVYHVSGDKRTPVGVGVAVSASTMVTDASLVSDAEDTTYEVLLADATRAHAELRGTGENGLAAFTLSSVKEGENIKSVGASFNRSSVKLGQTVIALTGVEQARVANGIVTSVVQPTTDTSTSTEEQTGGSASFETNIADANLAPGSVIVDTDGAVVGMYKKGVPAMISASSITAFVGSLQQASEKKESSSAQ